MSNPRMIPADEAKALRENARQGPWVIDPDGDVIKPHHYDAELSVHICSPEEGDRELVAAAPDLAHTVVEQDETIQTLSRLLAEAEEAAIERAEQIERVRNVLDQLDKYSDAAYLAYKANPEKPLLDGQAMAYEKAVVLIQRALGGTP